MNLFFITSKLLAFVEQPLNWVLALLVFAVVLSVLKRVTASKRVGLAAVTLLCLLGVDAFSESATRNLENLVPASPIAIDSVAGAIVLGGGVQGGPVPVERKQVLLNAAAERITVAVALARRYPSLKVVFSGLSPALTHRGISEADAAAQFFEQQGLAPARIVLEGRSRNTHENALFSAQLPGIDISKPWLLITSAAHMPRSYGVFRKAGWNVAPYPVDFQTGTTISYSGYSLAGGVQRWQVVLHELLGMAMYKATGRM
jgi:uncharacterized SAM-binding protein YcdF (DUF218 family)